MTVAAVTAVLAAYALVPAAPLVRTGPGSAKTAAAEPKRGTVIPDIRCLGDPKFSYALYMPSAYSDERTWPIIYALSPSGDGETPVRLLAGAAERFGYIVMGSNNSRNGPWEPILAAQQAMMKEAADRFRLDPKRSYAAGFSGGARAALDMALSHRRRFAGVILCGGVFSSRKDLPDHSPLAVYGLVGNSDLALEEHLRAEQQLRERRYTQWQHIFDGTHQWPSPSDFLEAVEFMEIAAMRRDLRPLDTTFVDRVAAARLASADALLESGDSVMALHCYRQAARFFKGSDAGKQAAEAVEHLKKNREVRQHIEMEEHFVEDLRQLNAWREEKPFTGAVRRMHQRVVQRGPMAERARLALHLCSIRLGMMGMQWMQDGEPEKARAFFLTADWVFPANPTNAYNAACASALLGEEEEAFQFLRAAARQRFDQPDLMREDEDLERIRHRKAFVEILEAVEENREKGISPPRYRFGPPEEDGS